MEKEENCKYICHEKMIHARCTTPFIKIIEKESNTKLLSVLKDVLYEVNQLHDRIEEMMRNYSI